MRSSTPGFTNFYIVARARIDYLIYDFFILG